MQLKEVLRLYKAHPGIRELGQMLCSNERQMYMSGAQASGLAMTFAALSEVAPEALSRVFLFVLDDAEEAGYFYHDLVQALGESGVLYFPGSFRRAVKYGQRDAANEVLRTEVLGRIVSRSLPLFIVSYPEALAERVAKRETMEERTLLLRRGKQIGIDEVESALVELGFRRTDYVYEPGQFAVRGSIVDVYSFAGEWPYRIDFFGDEIDSIRTFEVRTQLSVEKREEMTVVPDLHSGPGECVLEFLPEDTVVVTKQAAYLCETVNAVYKEGFSQQAQLAQQEDKTQLPDKNEILVDGETFQRLLARFRMMESGGLSTAEPSRKVVFETSPQPVFHKNFDLLDEVLSDYLSKGYTLYILADSQKQNERLKAVFDERNNGVKFIPVEKTLHAGYADHTLRICLFTDHQIFDRFHKYNLKSDKARSGKMALTLKELQQFEIGDYVVHIDHGVGRFGGLIRIPENGSIQEKIKIIYRNDDVIYVSIHALHKVSKYKGREGEPPRLNRLGGGAWERLKERTKEKIKDIARDLIRLYSARQNQQGFRFSPDGYMQHELEASFLYEDTPDQMKATKDVKADMECSKPMDRLVCGDVGFGKTEIAIRAAFKACGDGKQVALMVPTTVLAYQHYHTFTERLRDFPVRIEYLSRARTAKQTTGILRDLKEGRVDIIIGTHKLIGKTVEFKDLGLLIIDEEQKFGVATKERLRQMKTNVDTLTLTATPIPRTLQFSLMGARDLSVIQTPPPNRYPIQTELHVFSPEVIGEAINFEMSRNGQVFFVNNRIAHLEELEELVRKQVPDARIAVGHGQMPTEQLERILLDFANYDYDVLISTTIIESGIDMPNANTIIINGAQNFGLSDLHQMRGRVGRSNKKAFCYLLAPPLSSLSADARRRLQALESFSDLGSGIHIAMQDLDIRGAGNLLGSEQSGFIADLGYEAYQRILVEAVNELKNDEFGDLYTQQTASEEETGATRFVSDCQLDCDLPMCFPEDYVPGSSERMLLYRELDGLETNEQIEAFRQRMHDRFGPIPEEGEEFIRVVALRALGRHFGSERITLKGGRMRLHFVANPENAFYRSPAFGQLIAYATAAVARCRLSEKDGRRTMLVTDIHSVREAVALLEQVKRVKP
ncbi:MAG: transcription-repair coupling factor [Bacteroidaceae bacterium]|nr:transcription-repair coupling factor [Bacteroidaceae bacterium]